jgi:hypothetical protein
MLTNTFPHGLRRGLGHPGLNIRRVHTHEGASPYLNAASRDLGGMLESERLEREDPTLLGGQFQNAICCLASRIGYAILTSGRGFM